MAGFDAVDRLPGLARHHLRRMADISVEFFYPRRCAGCGLRGAWVCNSCLASINLYQDPRCERCGRQRTSLYCDCRGLPDAVDFIRAAAPFEGWLRPAIHQFKYEGESARATHLAAIMAPMLDSLPASFALGPVPLHKNRMKARGYNQSAYLCSELGRLTGRKQWLDLERIKDTPNQVGLPAVAREANVAGAFAVRHSDQPVPVHMLLIDDVVTTGSTVSECAKMIKLAGAQVVGVATLARD